MPSCRWSDALDLVDRLRNIADMATRNIKIDLNFKVCMYGRAPAAVAHPGRPGAATEAGTMGTIHT